MKSEISNLEMVAMSNQHAIVVGDGHKIFVWQLQDLVEGASLNTLVPVIPEEVS